MVLSKETDYTSDASTVLAEAVTVNLSDSTNNPKGDFLEVEAPPTQTETTTQQQQQQKKDDFGQEQSWSSGLCDCLSVIFEPLFWMGCCCTPLLYGQLMTRMKLDWCAKPDGTGAKTFGTVAILFILYLCFLLVGLEIMTVIFLIYALIIYTRTRGAIRRQFRIPPNKSLGCCNGTLEDFCCGFWCGCCSGIQMARHTHNNTRYPYEPCSPSGLPTYAPVLVTVVRDNEEETIAVV